LQELLELKVSINTLFLKKKNQHIINTAIALKKKNFNFKINKKPTLEIVNQAYIKIQKKIHPDISPETARLSAIVNEAKEIVIKDIS